MATGTTDSDQDRVMAWLEDRLDDADGGPIYTKSRTIAADLGDGWSATHVGRHLGLLRKNDDRPDLMIDHWRDTPGRVTWVVSRRDE